jgi:hypothetical protein
MITAVNPDKQTISASDKNRIASNIIDLLRSQSVTMMRVGANSFVQGVATLDEKPTQYVYVSFKASGENYKRGLTICVLYDSGSDDYIVRGTVMRNYQIKDVGNWWHIHADAVHDAIWEITNGKKVVQAKPVITDFNFFKDPARLITFIRDNAGASILGRDYDMKGQRKRDWMKVDIAESNQKIFRDLVSGALEKEEIQNAILKGEILPRDAERIILIAGLKVPEDIQSVFSLEDKYIKERHESMAAFLDNLLQESEPEMELSPIQIQSADSYIPKVFAAWFTNENGEIPKQKIDSLLDKLAEPRRIAYEQAWEKFKNDFHVYLSGDNYKIDDIRNLDVLEEKFEYGGAVSELLAPNGKPSNLSREQYELVRTPEFKAWFGDWEKDPKHSSKVVDDNGEPLVAFHGTTHEWTRYSKKKGNPENDMGRGFYATSSRVDAETNYLSEGSDITAQVEYYAEFLENDRNIKREKALELAEKKIKGGEEKIIEVFLKIKKPLILKERGGTYFDFMDTIVDDESGDSKPSRDAEKFQASFNKAAEKYELYKPEETYQEMLSNILDAGGEVNAYELVQIMKRSEGLLDGMFLDYRSYTWEFVKDIVMGMGFDGVIYDNPKIQFPRMYIPAGTKHYVAYSGFQIKLADGTNTTFNSKVPDIRFEEGGSVELLAPNGKPSNLNPSLHKLVRTPEFMAWFGNWINEPEYSSKVVDSNGEPLVVYHGTPNAFTRFNKGELDGAIHFTENRSYAEDYSGGYGRVIPVFLSAGKMYATNEEDVNSGRGLSPSQARAAGYDGWCIHYPDGTSDYAVFEPQQAKLADGANATFQIDNPDIRFADGGEVENNQILCENCGWAWLKEDGGSDTYVCHHCGHDNTDKYIGVFKKGGGIDLTKRPYKAWRELVNMSAAELETFMDTPEGKEAGLTKEEADEKHIHYGRESAKWIIKMKNTPVAKWTPEMWAWAKRQIAFIRRMSGNSGALRDDKGNMTRKLTSLLIWGHNPEKMATGGSIELRRKYYIKPIHDRVPVRSSFDEALLEKAYLEMGDSRMDFVYKDIDAVAQAKEVEFAVSIMAQAGVQVSVCADSKFYGCSYIINGSAYCDEQILDYIESLKTPDTMATGGEVGVSMGWQGGKLRLRIKSAPEFAVKHYEHYFEYVPIEEVLPYREHDREIVHKWDRGYLDRLAKQIAKNGITEPVVLDVDTRGYGIITEGNHRIASGLRNGIKYIPMRVNHTNRTFVGTMYEHKAKRLDYLNYEKAKAYGVPSEDLERSPMVYGFTKILPPAEVKN